MGDISKNPNYNDGDAASIILAQVSGTDISLLLGTFEVVGAEAVVIIANPNGEQISCNACNFINACVVIAKVTAYLKIQTSSVNNSSLSIIKITNHIEIESIRFKHTSISKATCVYI